MVRCIECGKEFQENNYQKNRQKLCSEECRKKHQIFCLLEWEKRNRTKCREYRKKFHEKHKKMENIQSIEYYKTHPEQYAKSGRKYRMKIKFNILSHYGGECACCGETRWEFLTIDHINGNGTEHRKVVGQGTKFYRWLIKNNFPSDYQVLCMNCNWALGKWGYCPHNQEGVEDVGTA